MPSVMNVIVLRFEKTRFPLCIIYATFSYIVELERVL